ncbi:MAG: tetratricopeptide repeat protein [Gaiellales bacterium]
MSPEALELFARGVALYAAGDADEALALWRDALALDPDNFVVRSQIWALEHPDRFYPAVDREWQELQLVKEGYDKPLP